MPSTQPPTGDVVQISPFLNLAGGNRWVYEDTATNGTVTISCPQPSPAHPHELQLTVDPKQILPDMVMEVKEVPERQYRWLKAILGSTTLTWKGGLLLPASWKVGETVTATSEEGNPLSGTLGQISLQLLNKPHPVPPEKQLPLPPGTLVIEIHQNLKDTGPYGSLISNTLMFADKIGLVYAGGENYGVFHVLKLKKWSGMH